MPREMWPATVAAAPDKRFLMSNVRPDDEWITSRVDIDIQQDDLPVK